MKTAGGDVIRVDPTRPPHREGAGVRVVITGAAGFLGSHLCDRFLADGHAVLGVDNLLTGSPANLAHLAREPRFEFLEQDVVAALDAAAPVDGVLHLASPASPVDYAAHPIATLDAGSLGTRRALELARARGARFLLASTSEVYGDPLVHPQPEGYWGHVNPVGPRAVYDEAKRFAEALTMAYRRAHGVETRIARLFNTYGPRMRPHDGRVVANFVVQALRGEPLTVYGDGAQTRSFCYVADAVEGLYRLFLAGDGQPTNVGNPQEFTVRQLAALVLALTGSASALVARPLPAEDPRQRRPDITRARTQLGWEPRVPLREGLLRTIAYFRDVVPTRPGEGARPLDSPAVVVATPAARSTDRAVA
jgi:dTDP-glucose 4,6-dehydratase